MGSSVNGPLNQGNLVVAADGTAFFTACNRPDGKGDCDIYQGRLTGDEVADVVNIAAVNSPMWETQPAVTADGRLLFFVSNRSGGETNGTRRDIFVSARNDSGWSAPALLAPPINSNFADESPASVGKKVYFASNRPGGMGGYDLYVTERKEGKWTEAMNLGPRFNTADDERSISVTASGEILFARFVGENADLYLASPPPAAGR